MTTVDWVLEQHKAGKKDNDIKNELIKNKWSEEKAQNLIDKAHLAGVLTPTTMIPALLGLTGIVLLWNYINSFSMDFGFQIHKHFFLITFVFILGGLALWGLWELAVKKKGYYQRFIIFLVGAVTGIGIGSWLLFLCLIFLYDVSIPIPFLLLIFSIVFAVVIMLSEYQFNRLLNKTFGTKKRDPKRLTYVALAIALFFLIVSVGITYFLEGKMIDSYNSNLERTNSMFRDAADSLNLEIDELNHEESKNVIRVWANNLPLKDGIREEMNVATYLTDDISQIYCEQTANFGMLQSIKQSILLTSEYDQIEQAVSDEELTEEEIEKYSHVRRENIIRLHSETQRGFSYEQTFFGLKPKALRDTEICWSRARGESYRNTDTVFNMLYPENPDLNDPNQRKAVRVLLRQQ